MDKPVVTFATSADRPTLATEEQPLLAEVASRGIDVRVAVWDDPTVDWQQAGIVVVRSVRDYAQKPDEFLAWTRRVPRLLNPAPVVGWNIDKHYLQDLAQRGLPTIPTIWLEPEDKFSKHQLHTRFPARGDFVVKPAVSSGGRGTGRYTSTDAQSRMEAIAHAQRQLAKGRSVMVQRYLEAIDTAGELSLIFFNGLISHAVSKRAMLHPSFRNLDEVVQDEEVQAREVTEAERAFGERVRLALHGYMKEALGRDMLLLFNRIDMVPDGRGGYYVMEISLVDGSLYLDTCPQAVTNFADAIAQRTFW
ncbi:ATP-grasp domain-containing protein [Buchananella hordeovulneris]|uniref:Glutathione synthetase n=1 Tax=Buchananella hordeovulneris TaxID=52770 RepID=A0A1Q5PWR6_9ACTO|nr:glutathione synthetase [Buchananella hordeovulneris]OKL52063.1 glutathione synthetase [Buchananella hordeovulneris]